VHAPLLYMTTDARNAGLVPQARVDEAPKSQHGCEFNVVPGLCIGYEGLFFPLDPALSEGRKPTG